MTKLRSLLAAATFASLASLTANAATFIIPDDDVLIRRATSVVTGTVLDSRAELTAGGGVRTVTELWVDRVVLGPIQPGAVIDVVEPGGITPELSLRLHGVPQFSAGERVLLLIEENARGEHTTLEFALGKFSLTRSDGGVDYYLRENGSICGWAPGFRPYRERARRADEFLRYIEDVVAGRTSPTTYSDEYQEVCLESAAEVTPSPEAAIAYSFCDCRWSVFTPPSATISFLTAGTQTGISNSTGAVSVGTGLWTSDGGSTIQYQRGGTTTASQGFVEFDGINAVLFNDPGNEIPGAFDGVGVLAIGGPWGGGSHSFSGETFQTIGGADVVVQNGVGSSSGITQGQFEVILAHELGHTLGFRHSDDFDAPGRTENALMNSFLNRSSAFLSDWDRQAAGAMYGAGACVGVTINSQPQSASTPAGTSRTLAVGVTGTPSFTFQWFRGASGDVTSPVQGPTVSSSTSNNFTTPALSDTTNYWVRVTNCGGGNSVDSNTATVTVTCAAVIAQQPQSQSVPEGSGATLSVSTGTGTYSYQWFRGNSGNSSSPIPGATSNTLSTGALTTDQSYWVRVTRTDCDPDHVANSSTATVTICQIPSIPGEPQDAAVVAGSGATLSVTAAGSGVTYQWYLGTRGVTTNPLPGATAASFYTGNLSTTSTYWVRVSNACGGPRSADSRTVTVTVYPQCVPPGIVEPPQSLSIISGKSATLSVAASGTGLLFQWFEGESGDVTRPVGTGAPSFNTGALTQTKSFWVRLSNGCGQLNGPTVTVTVEAGCPAGVLCAIEGRFRLTLAARDHRTGTVAAGVPLQQNDIFGYYSLPALTGDAENPEVFVKMLDGRAINGNFWTFFGGLTDLEYTLSVRDAVTGETKNYFKPGGSSAGGFDIGNGTTPESCAGQVEGTVQPAEAPSSCVPNVGQLCLNGSRFRVELAARDQRTGAIGSGSSIPQGNIFGYFSIPALTGNASNPEVFVKIIDARIVNGQFWIFYSGLTDLEYTLTVTDSVTGKTKTYTKAGGSACGAFDTRAFTGE